MSSDAVVARTDVAAGAAAAALTVNTRTPMDGTEPMNAMRVAPPLAPSTWAGTDSPVAASITLTAPTTPAAAGKVTVASIASFRSMETGL